MMRIDFRRITAVSETNEARALHLYSPTIQLYARVFLVSAPLGILRLICRAALESEGNFATSSATQTVMPMLTLLGLIALWKTHRINPKTAAYAYLLNFIPINLWMVIKVWRDYRPRFAGLWGSARILFSYGVRSWVMPRHTEPDAEQALLLHHLSLVQPQQPPPRITTAASPVALPPLKM